MSYADFAIIVNPHILIKYQQITVIKNVHYKIGYIHNLHSSIKSIFNDVQSILKRTLKVICELIGLRSLHRALGNIEMQFARRECRINSTYKPLNNLKLSTYLYPYPIPDLL